jgi:hypothetical protein
VLFCQVKNLTNSSNSCLRLSTGHRRDHPEHSLGRGKGVLHGLPSNGEQLLRGPTEGLGGNGIFAAETAAKDSLVIGAQDKRNLPMETRRIVNLLIALIGMFTN